MLLLHARAASYGVGSPRINKNNHPFVNYNKTKALIHNGRIPDLEYGNLKKKYSVVSDCDSEIILRIFEHCLEPLDGVRLLWSYLYRGHMAVAIGERKEAERILWLFRNDYRPIWLTDMRETLGQVFFFSDPDIWDEAVSSSGINLLGRIKLIELPKEIVWKLVADSSGAVSLKKYKVILKEIIPWSTNGEEKIEIKRENSNIEVISRLNESEEVIGEKAPYRATYPNGTKANLENALTEVYSQTGQGDLFKDVTDSKKNLEKLNEYCSQIKNLVNDIGIAAENAVWESSLDDSGYHTTLTSLEDVTLELEGTLRILSGDH